MDPELKLIHFDNLFSKRSSFGCKHLYKVFEKLLGLIGSDDLNITFKRIRDQSGKDFKRMFHGDFGQTVKLAYYRNPTISFLSVITHSLFLFSSKYDQY